MNSDCFLTMLLIWLMCRAWVLTHIIFVSSEKYKDNLKPKQKCLEVAQLNVLHFCLFLTILNYAFCFFVQTHVFFLFFRRSHSKSCRDTRACRASCSWQKRRCSARSTWDDINHCHEDHGINPNFISMVNKHVVCIYVVYIYMLSMILLIPQFIPRDEISKFRNRLVLSKLSKPALSLAAIYFCINIFALY